MRHRSKKRTAQDDADAEVIRQYRLTHSRCLLTQRFATELHHIAGRNHPDRNNPANLLPLTTAAHLLFTDNKFYRAGYDNKTAGVLVALALKSLYDRKHYDRLAVLRIWGRAETAITEHEVGLEVLDLRHHQRFGR